MFRKLFKFGGESNFGWLTNTIVTVIGAGLIILLWHFIAVWEVVPQTILPDPFKVLTCIPNLISEYHLFGNAWFTVQLNLWCYFYAILLSIPIGFVIALFPVGNILVGKYIGYCRYLPLPAITAIFIAIWGLTFSMKMWFLTFAIMLYIVPTVVNKINDLQNPANVKDNVYLQTIQTLGATNWQKLRYVYFPYVTSGIANDILNLVAVSYTYVVIAEMIYKDGAISGIGALIHTMIRQSYMPEAFALLFTIVIIGALQDYVFKKITKKLFPYKY